MSPREGTPESLEAAALAAYRADSLEEAARLFAAAVAGFTASDQPARAAEAANSLCVTLLSLGRPSEALDVVRDTPAVLERAGLASQAALAHGNLASALEACGRLQEAEVNYAKAISLLIRPEDAESRAACQAALSRLLLRRGRPLEALTSMQASLEGKEHPGLPRRILRRLLQLPFRLLRRE